MCIWMYSINSNGIEEYSPEMFGSTSPSRLSKQFLLHGVQKFALNGKNPQIYSASVKRILLLCTHANPEWCYHLIFHLTISKDLTEFKQWSISVSWEAGKSGDGGLSQSLPLNLVPWDCLTSSSWQKEQPLYKANVAPSLLFSFTSE